MTGAGYGGATTHGPQPTAHRSATMVVRGQTAVAPTTGSLRLRPPLAENEVRQTLDLLLQRGTFESASGKIDLGGFQSAREAYFGVYYEPKTGRMSVRKVATGNDDDKIRMGLSMLMDKLKAGEVLVGGFHNHPEGTTVEPSSLDKASAKTLQEALPGYRDFVLVTDGPKASLVEIKPDNTIDAVFMNPERLTYASIFKMNREIQQGVKGTAGLKRADPAHIPGDEEHVHTDEGPAIKKSGGWKDGQGELSNGNKKWLRGWGWNV